MMRDASDYDLLKTPAGPPVRQRTAGFWVIVVVLVLAAGGAGYLIFGRRPATPPPAAARAEAPPAPSRPLGGEAEVIALPPLNETDALVRELVKKISSNPRVAAWLATDDLIRSFTIGVANVAHGTSAARQLTMVRPSGRFQVIQRGSEMVIDPRSYARYDMLAGAAASMDAEGSARLYATLKPRIEDAARELGDSSFDRTLERAIVLLLETPAVEDPIAVQPKGIAYGFADQRLDSLTNAQKHLLRTGPRNVLIVQTSLRAIALALGIPAERLPRPTSIGH
jgi:Protein of unknown function (DUF3014)